MNYVDNQGPNESSKYWDDFYSIDPIASEVIIPSQFAAFVLGEIKQQGVSLIYDLGCGNGRDAKFFLDNGCKIVAVDRSRTALEKTISLCGEGAMLKTVQQDFGKKFNNWPVWEKQSKAIYARFLVHSLTTQALINFISNCGAFMNEGDFAFFEYRTSKDQHRKKETANHYRNFVSANLVCSLAKSNGLTLQYSNEGTGFAKFKEEDAHVSRQIFQKEHATSPLHNSPKS